jgi:hypothetical protein
MLFSFLFTTLSSSLIAFDITYPNGFLMILYGRKETIYIPTSILVIRRRPYTLKFVVNSLQYYLGSGLPK